MFSNLLSPPPISLVTGDSSVDAAHGESSPPSDCDPEVVKPVPPPFVPGRHPIDKKQNDPSNWSLSSNPKPQLLPINVASLGAFDETRRPYAGHVRGCPPVPSLCVGGCIRPTGRGSGASDNTVWSQECGRLPIPPLPIRQQSSVTAPMPVDQRPVVCTDQVVIRGKRCDSASSLASLICKHSGWWSYLPYTVQHTCNRASWKAWSCGSAWSRATLYLQLRKWSPFRQHTSSVAPGHLVYSLAGVDESLPTLRVRHLLESLIWGWLALLVLRIASRGASGKRPRMESWSSNHARSCCTQIPPMVRARPSYPARNCRRHEGTVPWSDFGAPFGGLFGDGMQSRVGELCSCESRLESRISWWIACRGPWWCYPVRRVCRPRAQISSVPAPVSR